jgi:hypothetical protein
MVDTSQTKPHILKISTHSILTHLNGHNFIFLQLIQIHLHQELHLD